MTHDEMRASTPESEAQTIAQEVTAARRRPARKVGTPATQRMRKLECECGTSAYQSRAQIKRGLLTCPCGSRLIPVDPDDAALVLTAEELERHPAVEEMRRELDSVAHGQAPHGLRGRHLQPAEVIAEERVEQRRRADAKRRRLAAIRPPQIIPF